MATIPTEEINTAYFLRIACGQLGLKAHEFYAYRAAHFFEHMRGHVDARKADQQFQFLMLRQQTVFLMNVQLAEKDQIRNINKFWPSPWDEEEEKETVEITEEENTEMNKKMIGAFNNHFNQ